MNVHITHRTALVLVALFVTIAGTGVWFFNSVAGPKDSKTVEYNDALKNLAATFEEIEEEANAGDVNAVVAILEEKVAGTTNPTERGALLLSIAQLKISTDIPLGVAAYKSIGVDASLSNTARGAAILGLAFLYHTNAIDREALTNSVFTDEAPYGDMRPTDDSLLARERAYAALILYAESLYPSAIGNAYVAKYWAREHFLYGTEGALQNAKTHLTRSSMLESNTEKGTSDITIPMGKVINAVSKVYLVATEEAGTTEAIAELEAQFDEYHATILEQIATYADNDVKKRQMNEGFYMLEHELWKETLTLATLLAKTDTAEAEMLTQLYVNHIRTDAGLRERASAIDASSDIAPLLQELRTLSPSLEEIL